MSGVQTRPNPSDRHTGPEVHGKETQRENPLCRVAGIEFPEAEVSVQGGSLYIFSDGLTEACTDSGEHFGSEGLITLLTKFADQPVAKRVESIVAAVGELELRDDLTLLAVDDS